LLKILKIKCSWLKYSINCNKIDLKKVFNSCKQRSLPTFSLT